MQIREFFPLLKYLLSDSMILGSMGAVSSLPGAQLQHHHRDHANIFDTTFGLSGRRSLLSGAATVCDNRSGAAGSRWMS